MPRATLLQIVFAPAEDHLVVNNIFHLLAKQTDVAAVATGISTLNCDGASIGEPRRFLTILQRAVAQAKDEKCACV